MAVTTCMGQNVTSAIGNNLESTCMCRHMYAFFHDGAAELPSLMLLLLPETGSTPAFLPKYSTLWFSVTFSIFKQLLVVQSVTVV